MKGLGVTDVALVYPYSSREASVETSSLETLRLEVGFLQLTQAVRDGKAQNKAPILFALTFCPFLSAP